MNNQIDVHGWLSVPAMSSDQDSQDKPQEAIIVTEINTGTYPKTNEHTSRNLFYLGILLCLIVFLIWCKQRLSNKQQTR
jgi:flagellar biogenesis protein FliO